MDLLTIIFLHILFAVLFIPFQMELRDISLGITPINIGWFSFCSSWTLVCMILPIFFLFREKLFSPKSPYFITKLITLIFIFSYILLPIIIPQLPFITSTTGTIFKKLFAFTLIFMNFLNLFGVAPNLIGGSFSEKLRIKLKLHTINLIILYSFFMIFSIGIFFCGSVWGFLIGPIFNIIFGLIFSSFGFLQFKILKHYKVFDR